MKNYKVTNLGNRKNEVVSAANVAAAVSAFMQQAVVFLGAFVAVDGCFRGHAYGSDGRVVGHLEIVRTA